MQHLLTGSRQKTDFSGPSDKSREEEARHSVAFPSYIQSENSGLNQDLFSIHLTTFKQV